MDNNINPSIEEKLRKELNALGAREYEIVALSLDPDRGLAALQVARKRGAEHPVSYAIKLFDKPDWQPASESRRVATNLAVDRSCIHCGGDRFVAVTDGPGLYEETYAPCQYCNASTNTERWVGAERRVTVAR